MKNDHPAKKRFLSSPLFIALVIVILAVAAVGALIITQTNSAAPTSNSQTSSAGAELNQKPVPMKLVRRGSDVTIDLYSEEVQQTVAPGVTANMWTFDGTTPGPVIYLQQGDKVTLRLHNLDPYLAHSIDLHAVTAAPNKTFLDAAPGGVQVERFTAAVPGVFLYHCATVPMPVHLTKGMYGAVVVTPKGQPQPTYTIVQSEIYPNGDYTTKPEYVVFDGNATRYIDHPLTARAGRPITIAFVNAGPNLFSAFHVIGTVFSDVQDSGNPRNHLYGVSTYTVAPGEGALFTVRFAQPGVYTFVSHAIDQFAQGAAGKIRITA